MRKNILIISIVLLPSWVLINCAVAQNIQRFDDCANNCNSNCNNRVTCQNQCSSQCQTVNCRSNCARACSNTCQTRNCASATCGNCVSNCANRCSSASCVDGCSRNCDCRQIERVENEPSTGCVNECSNSSNCKEVERVNTTTRIIQPGRWQVWPANTTNHNLVNVTAKFNISNVINHHNNISSPVYVNVTNVNNVNSTTRGGRGGKTIVIWQPPVNNNQPPPIILPPIYPPYPPAIIQQPPTNQPCCQVIHPRQCYSNNYFGGMDNSFSGGTNCYAQRHNECSNICSSPVVQLERGGSQLGCHYIQNYPYAYCGNYQRTDCGNCYSCNGAYNPSACSRSVGCSDSCRANMQYNCVSRGGGSYCS